MHLSIMRITVQQDRINPPPPDSEEGDLLAWKRVLAEGLRTEGTTRMPFTVTLDLRSRLMQVASEKDALPIGTALINKMCEFILVPRSRLFMPSGEVGPSRFEWIVADAVHVSGLLHRVKEAKEFLQSDLAPPPPGFSELRARLLDSVAENCARMLTWQESLATRQLAFFIRFEAHDWELLQADFLRLSDDVDMQQQFARFFAGVRGWDNAVATLLHSPAPLPDPDPRRAVRGPVHGAHVWINNQGNATQRLGVELLRKHGTEEQRQRAHKR